MNLISRMGAAGILAGAVGCASPANNYYSLSATDPGSPHRTNGAATVSVTDVQVPAYLDRPQIVVKRDQSRADIREYDRWIEPVDGMIRAALSADLAARLGRNQILDKADAATWIISLNIEAFGQTGDQAALRAQWTLTRQKDAQALPPRSFSQSVPLSTPQMSESVAAMSRLLGLLSDDMAASIPSD